MTRALTVVPGEPGSLRVEDVDGLVGAHPAAAPEAAEVQVDGVAVGICGTDHEIVSGGHGSPPAGQDRLVIGHESLGRVRSAPEGSGFVAGDLVVGVVRRPDPAPCAACAHGEFDMCRNDDYTERGIKQLHGYASERWSVPPEYAVRLDPALEDVGMLLEPASVVTKAWEQIERVGARAYFDPQTVLVTGAGPIGLLAALLGSRRGLDVHVLDRVTHGPKPELVDALGATYHHDLEDAVDRVRPDIVLEATGASEVVFAALSGTGRYGVVCLTGVSAAGHEIKVDAGSLNRDLVLQNDAVVGSVNSNVGHYGAAADTLAAADPAWMARLVSRRLPLDDFAAAFEPRDDDVKVVLTLGG